MPKSWVFTKTTDYQPKGVLSLGQILSDPANPASVLQPYGPLALPAALKPETQRQDGVNMDAKSEMAAMFGVWANATGLLPVGAQATVAKDASSELIWRFESLRSEIVAPPLQYTREAMQHGDVPEQLQRWAFRRRVYMITGVRTAHEARMERRESHSSRRHGAAAADGADQGVPAGGGMRGGYATSGTDNVTFEKTTDFVFAYRLNEVNYRGKVTHKPYTKGETSSAGEASGPARRGDDRELDGFDVIGVDEEDVDAEDCGLDAMVMPGFEGVECFLGV